MNDPPDKDGENSNRRSDRNHQIGNQSMPHHFNEEANNAMAMDESSNTDDTNSRSQERVVSDSNQQKRNESKVFNLNKTSSYSNDIYVYIEKSDNHSISRLHPMFVGHLLHNKLNVKNITNIERVGINRIKVWMRTLLDANKLVENKKLKEENLIAYIPNNLLTRKAIVKQVDTIFNEEYLFNNIICNGTLLEVKRLKRKVLIDGEPVLIPKQMILLTFEGNILPSHIVINSVRCPVEPYVQKVIQCFKCLRFGHVANQCKNTKTLCTNCSKDMEDQHQCRDPQDSFCIYCKTQNHKSTSKNCPTFIKQMNIKKQMAYNNSTYLETKNNRHGAYSTVVSNNRYQILENLEEFPPLPTENSRVDYRRPHNTHHLRPHDLHQKLSLSQPNMYMGGSTSMNETNPSNSQSSKKRKAVSPPVEFPKPMFPPIINPINPLPPLTYSSDNLNNEEIIDIFSTCFETIITGLNSLEDIRHFNKCTLKNKIACILEQLFHNRNNNE